MLRHYHIPLAWLNLARSPKRMALFAAGVGFAVVLMFVQNGCRNALLDSSVQLLDHLVADLVVVGRKQSTIVVRTPFPRALLARAAELPAVEVVSPVYLEYSGAFRHTGPPGYRRPNMSIRAVGIDPDASVFDFAALSDPDIRRSLALPGGALFDCKAAPAKRPPDTPADAFSTIFGPVAVGTRSAIADRDVEVVGFVEIGKDFGTDGTLVIGLDTFAEALRPRPLTAGLDMADIGVVRLKGGSDVSAAKRDLADLLGPDEVRVLTKAEFRELEKAFWLHNTPVGAVFGFGLAMGVLVGAVICFQILSTDIRDNLGAYGTLLAVGYTRGYLLRVIIEEAVLLAVLGFVPGWLVSVGLYAALEYATALPMTMTAPRVLFLFALTLALCVASGWFAGREVRRIAPAELF